MNNFLNEVCEEVADEINNTFYIRLLVGTGFQNYPVKIVNVKVKREEIDREGPYGNKLDKYYTDERVKYKGKHYTFLEFRDYMRSKE